MTRSDVYQLIMMISGFATAIGVFFAAIQVRMYQRQETTSFEDDMAREYREIVQRIPTRALLGDSLDGAEFADTFDEFYRYLSLSNEQVHLWKSGRVSRKTWQHWREGIRRNLSRPSFQRAWSEIKSRTQADEFGGLRALERDEV
jgi:hypothetical protein